ncbi:hypothetical protein AB6A40_007796 [Gnathostoma spinigerum]|uniref:ACB domain-containing protein n=1 Tax=Gnathostoma spinigerum TaxID=75299 RepID=A0ABD6EPI3_9BILA
MSSNNNANKEDEVEKGSLIVEYIENLLARREKGNNAARINWLKWQREMRENREREKQFKAYWERRKQDDKDLWRNKDFANAVDKMSRAGYHGKHGNYNVPSEILIEFDALYMQVTVGDFDGNYELDCAHEWIKLRGTSKEDAQRKFIRQANKVITKYGWNPPEGWT